MYDDFFRVGKMTDSITHSHKADSTNKLITGKSFECDFSG